MHTVESFHPRPELRRYVRAYAQRRAEIGDATVMENVPVRLEQVMEFQFRDPFRVDFDAGASVVTPDVSVIGPQTDRRAVVSLYGKIESFAVFFEPAGFSQLFGIPMRLLLNEGHDCESILGSDIREIWNQLGEVSGFRARVDIMERFLVGAMNRSVFSDRMANTANRILGVQGRVHVAVLAKQQGMGLRQFERIFGKEVGVAPKRYARVARLQSALDLKVAAPERSWLEVSHYLGYHDQMHMIHDFKSLCGNSPRRILGQMGDMRPDALVRSRTEDINSGRIFTMQLD